MSITRTTATDGAAGTDWNNAFLQSVYDQIDGRWTRQTVSSTGTQNNLSITSASLEADVLHCTNATVLSITGIIAPASPVKPGKRLWIVAAGAGVVELSHQNASSTAANRLANFTTTGVSPGATGIAGVTCLAGGTTAIAGGAACYVYDDVNSRWRMVAHDQGSFLTRTFAAGNYTASTGTWTVASATRDAFKLTGRELHYKFDTSGTTSGTPTQVRITLPFTATAVDDMSYYIANTGGAASETGFGFTAAASATLALQRNAAAAFAAGTVSVGGTLICEVT